MKPILFSTPMVQAILDGRKTQTRRVVKPLCIPQTGLDFEERVDYSRLDKVVKAGYVPAYRPGDILWVRETWTYHEGAVGGIIFKARCPKKLTETKKWRPSIHMPRAAARIFLRVTDVRVERLRSISEADAIAEGVIGLYPPSERHKKSETKWVNGHCTECIYFDTVTKTYSEHKPCYFGVDDDEPLGYFPSCGCYYGFKLKPDITPDSPLLLFDWLWRDVGIVPGCGHSPWVWVYEFERCEKPEVRE